MQPTSADLSLIMGVSWHIADAMLAAVNAGKGKRRILWLRHLGMVDNDGIKQRKKDAIKMRLCTDWAWHDASVSDLVIDRVHLIGVL